MTGNAKETHHKLDILVIGGGGAAALAALEARNIMGAVWDAYEVSRCI